MSRIWIARTATLAEMVCENVWRNLTQDEWRRFVGTESCMSDLPQPTPTHKVTPRRRCQRHAHRNRLFVFRSMDDAAALSHELRPFWQSYILSGAPSRWLRASPPDRWPPCPQPPRAGHCLSHVSDITAGQPDF